MTLTYPILNRARCVLWLVNGPEKAQILQRLASGDASIPAGRIRRDTAVVLADRAAASNIQRDGTKENSMRIGIAADHGGFPLKEQLVVRLKSAGHEVVDFRCSPVDAD